jgi:hypothetical protein
MDDGRILREPACLINARLHLWRALGRMRALKPFGRDQRILASGATRLFPRHLLPGIDRDSISDACCRLKS